MWRYIQVYDHHWIAVASTHTNEICSSSLNYVFGIGAESRHGAVDLPDGHAYVVDNDHTNWGANIHLLRVTSMPIGLGTAITPQRARAGLSVLCR